jgi:hypothetical protein
MSNTLTIFFCGTGATSQGFQNRDYHSGELVATLYQNCVGEPYIDKLIFDGPGSGNLREHEKWIESDNRTEAMGIARGWGWENNVKAAITVALAHVNHETYVSLRGLIVKNLHPLWVPDEYRTKCLACGKGFGTFTRKSHCRKCGEIFCSACMSSTELSMEHLLTDKYTLYTENSYKALKPGKGKVCKKCFDDRQSEISKLRNEIAEHRIKHPLTTINLIGWSRGGATCIMFANACDEIEAFNKIEFNLFTLDPVPGYGAMDKERITLKSNVKNYATVIQMDEVSKAFAPVIPQTDKTTMCHYFTMPGRHATGVGNAALDGEKGKKNKHPNPLFLTAEEPGYVTRDLAEIFLEDWGTELINKLDLKPEQVMNLYDRMLKKDIEFKRMRESNYGLGSQGNLFGPKVRDICEGGEYKPITEVKRLQCGFFINIHHQKHVYDRWPILEPIWSVMVINKRPKKNEEIHQLQEKLCKRLEIIPQFEQVAPGLFGCILERATKYWESRLMIHNLKAAGLM